MEEKNGIIKFNDGTTLEVKINGNCYITNEKLNFPSDLTNISIKIDDKKEQIIEFGKIIETAALDERYWFGILEIPETQRAIVQVRSDVDYIAMELDIDL